MGFWKELLQATFKVQRTKTSSVRSSKTETHSIQDSKEEEELGPISRPEKATISFELPWPEYYWLQVLASNYHMISLEDLMQKMVQREIENSHVRAEPWPSTWVIPPEQES